MCEFKQSGNKYFVAKCATYNMFVISVSYVCIDVYLQSWLSMFGFM